VGYHVGGFVKGAAFTLGVSAPMSAGCKEGGGTLTHSLSAKPGKAQKVHASK
jgi:hypothetical protein